MSDRKPPSFNTFRKSNRKTREQRQGKAKFTLLAICVVVVLLLISLAVFLFCAIADALDGPNGSKSDIKYESITKQASDIHKGELILVNQTYEYTFPETEDHLINIFENRSKVDAKPAYQINSNLFLFHRDVFAQLDEMLKQACMATQDTSALITTAYRSYEDQAGKQMAQGHSDYHTGYCVEIRRFQSGATSNLESTHWIYQNCAKYGFIVRYPEGKSLITGIEDYTYCFRYVGVPHATYIMQNNLCLEEYVELLRTKYAGDDHLTINAEGKQYEVYYVAKSDKEVTTIEVPKNYSYTISGDNIGGFIVTVNMSEPRADK